MPLPDIFGPLRADTGSSGRSEIGLCHIVAAFLWFGTILYVHLMLRPGYAARGLPGGEVALGIMSMTIVGLSGILLMISRIKSLDVLYVSQWGQLLSLKIMFYIIMVSSALFTIFFVGPKLKRGKIKATIPDNRIFDPLTLQAFDGKNGSSAFIAYKGNVYDMTALRLWKGGLHMKHQAGHDLSDALAKAPQGEEKLEKLKVIGSYDSSLTPIMSFAQKTFYFIAYMNLFIVFVVLFIIAYWRWGL